MKLRDVKLNVENEGEENQEIDESQMIENDLKAKEELEKKIQKISTSSQSGIFVAMFILFMFIITYFVGIYIYSRVGI